MWGSQVQILSRAFKITKMKVSKDREKFVLGILVVFIVTSSALLIILLIPSIDKGISNFLISKQTPFGIKFMGVVSALGSREIIFIIILVMIIALYNTNKRFYLFFIISTLSGLAFELIIKVAFNRVRPLNPFVMGFSFPSGHTFMTFLVVISFSYIIWPKYKKTSLYIFLIPLVIAFTRIYLNVHWLSDVIGSIAMASAWFLVVIKVLKKTD